MQTIFIGTLFSLFSKKKTQILLLRPNKDIAALLELYAAGKICPAIDKVYPLSGVPDAMRYFGEGDKKGKVIISMK